MRRSVVFAIGGIGLVSAVLFSCIHPNPPVPLRLAVDGAWDNNTPRTIVYDVSLSKGGASETHKATLSFLGGGRVRINEDGRGSKESLMSADGQLTDPVLAYLGLLCAVPTKSALDKPGTPVIAQYPSPQERAARGNDVIYGSTITSRANGTGPVIDVSFDGTVSMVDNAGSKAFLSSFLGDSPIPEVAAMASVVRSETPYLTGTARFDRAAGQVVSLDAYMIAFPVHPVPPGSVASQNNAIHVSLQKVGG